MNSVSLQEASHRKAEVYAEVMEKFKPVFHHFFMEQFPTPPQWFERRLAYTRSVAASSMGRLLMLLLLSYAISFIYFQLVIWLVLVIGMSRIY